MNDISSPMLVIHEGVWGYQQKRGWFEPASPVSFSVDRGEIVLLTGDNGSGKTTILRGVLGLIEKRAGKILWGVHRKDVGYVPQEGVIDGSVPASALDVVRTGQPLDWGGSRDRARQALTQVGIENFADSLFGSLSGGQRQRVLVARALVGNPGLLILDEPTVNVDAETANQIGLLLDELRHDGLGMIITSHVRDWIKPTRVVSVFASSKEVDLV